MLSYVRKKAINLQFNIFIEFYLMSFQNDSVSRKLCFGIGSFFFIDTKEGYKNVQCKTQHWLN